MFAQIVETCQPNVNLAAIKVLIDLVFINVLLYYIFYSLRIYSIHNTDIV